MLEDGFSDELGEIVKACPKSRQTMLFSATMTDNVDQLIRMSLHRPVRLMIDATGTAAARLTQEFVRIRAHRESDRPAVLLALCVKTFRRRTIVFFRSKAAAHQMRILFGLVGLRAAELHGDLSQEQRLEALEKFRDSECDFLLATDLASRGLDIKGIETVINFNMPQNFAQYLHRVGRTARAGRNGRAVTLVGEADRKLLKLAVKSSQRERIKHRVVPPELIAKYREKLDGLKDQVKEVMNEEKEDRALRTAEMEMRKSENMLNHGDEIYSRPARTWFQSDKDRKEAKVVGRDQYNSQFATEEDNKRKRDVEKPKRDKFSGLNRTKRRRLEVMQEEDAQARLSRQKAVRSAKKAALPGKITYKRSALTEPPVAQKKKRKADGIGFAMDLADGSKQNAGLASKVNRDAERAKGKKGLKSGAKAAKGAKGAKGGKKTFVKSGGRKGGKVKGGKRR
ncbi:hypothetical protein BC938DRAFT_481022 [Jimgerdemannia flammicorona]|nr:hypothetical protein BC938DRAFT_481022 [Jimgerdemannia flammicorona]